MATNESEASHRHSVMYFVSSIAGLGTLLVSDRYGGNFHSENNSRSGVVVLWWTTGQTWIPRPLNSNGHIVFQRIPVHCYHCKQSNHHSHHGEPINPILFQVLLRVCYLQPLLILCNPRDYCRVALHPQQAHGTLVLVVPNTHDLDVVMTIANLTKRSLSTLSPSIPHIASVFRALTRYWIEAFDGT